MLIKSICFNDVDQFIILPTPSSSLQQGGGILSPQYIVYVYTIPFETNMLQRSTLSESKNVRLGMKIIFIGCMLERITLKTS